VVKEQENSDQGDYSMEEDNEPIEEDDSEEEQ
jgi:hypothetical protein